MKNICYILFCFSLFFLSAAEPPKEWKGTYCGVKSSTEIIVSSPEEWQNLWKMVGTSPAITDSIDFSREWGIGIFLGEKPTAGYSAEIKSIKETKAGTQITFFEKKPEPHRIVAQVLTQPYLIRLVRKPQKNNKIIFRKEKNF